MTNLNDAWKKLATSSPEERPKYFVEYCEANIDAQELRELSVEEASANICSCSSYIDDIRSNPMLEDVIEIACNLELPPEHRDVETHPSWDKLKELVEESKMEEANAKFVF